MPEKIVRNEQDIVWLPKPNESLIILSDRLPPLELIKTALALAFAGNRLLMTHLTKRGWDLPGGHIEAEEQPEEALHREISEETGATLTEVRLLGYQRLRLLGPRPADYRYPYPESYQVFYSARVATLGTFQPTTEALARRLLPPAEARASAWVQRNQELYEAALALRSPDVL